MSDISGLNLWLRWTIANGIGELLGLGGVFAMGFFMAPSGNELNDTPAMAGVVLIVMSLAAFEGAVVGLVQWLALRRALPALSLSGWLGATVAGAVIAWLLGMIPGMLIDADTEAATTPSLHLVLTAAAVIGAILGIILASAQWWVLRRHVKHASLWLPANALGWFLAMPLIFWLVDVAFAEQEISSAIVLLMLGCGAAGLVAGGIHGLFLVRLVAWQSTKAVSPV